MATATRDPYAIFVGRKIHAAREKSGLTLRELADKIEMSFGHLSDLENGNGIAGTKILQRLAAALGCKITAFLPD